MSDVRYVISTEVRGVMPGYLILIFTFVKTLT